MPMDAGPPGWMIVHMDALPTQVFLGTRRHPHDTGWRRLPLALLTAPTGSPYRLELRGSRVDLPPGSLVVVPTQLEHRFRVPRPGLVTDICCLHVHLTVPDGGDLFEAWNVPLLLPAAAATRFTAIVRGLVAPIAGPAAVALQACRLQAARWQVASLVLAHATPRADSALRVDPRIAACREWLHQHPRERPDRAILAAIAGVERSRLHQLMVAAVGCGPAEWVRREKVAHAQRLLLSSGTVQPSVADVAAAVGYPDPYHFSRVFRSVTGQSPRRWRERVRAGA